MIAQSLKTYGQRLTIKEATPALFITNQKLLAHTTMLFSEFFEANLDREAAKSDAALRRRKDHLDACFGPLFSKIGFFDKHLKVVLATDRSRFKNFIKGVKFEVQNM